MNDWIDFEKDNIPSDLLVAKYEFRKTKFADKDITFIGVGYSLTLMIEDIVDHPDVQYQYRKKVKRMPFGRFWDDGDSHQCYSYLKEDSNRPWFRYTSLSGETWQYFKEGLPEPYLEVSDD